MPTSSTPRLSSATSTPSKSPPSPSPSSTTCCATSTSPPAGIAPDDVKTGLLLAKLVTGVRKILDETATLEDPFGEALAENLPQLFTNPADATEALAIVDKTSALGQAARDQFVLDHFGRFMNATQAKDSLSAAPDWGTLDDLDERYAYVLRPVVATLKKEGLLVELVASALGVDATASRALLFDRLSAPIPKDDLLVSSFIDNADLDSPLDRSNATAQFTAMDPPGQVRHAHPQIRPAG